MRTSNLIIALCVLLICSCSKRSEYQSLVDKELATGVRQDSILLGTYFGMTANQFYDHCWDLNRKGLIREGSSNTTVYYEIYDLPYKAALEFYPIFKDGKIQSMTAFVHYIGWAPWNRDLWSEVLIEETKRMFETWYGKRFIEVKSPGRGKAYVQVNGNRRILLFYTRDERVEILFSDLTNDDEFFNPDEA